MPQPVSEKRISTFSSPDACTLTLTVPFRHRKCVGYRVEEKIGEYLSVWTRIAVHRQIRLAVDAEGHALLFETRRRLLITFSVRSPRSKIR